MQTQQRDRPVEADGDEAVSSAVQHLTEDQMLVNQALVEKVFACEHTEAALRVTEKQLHSLLANQRAIRDAERKAISREIHDSLGQNLLALRLDIATLHLQTHDRHARLHGRVGMALDNVDDTLRTVRHLLAELRPAGFELGLLATVEIEARRFTIVSGIACTISVSPGLDTLELGEDSLMSLYRVLQEALNNVLRHSLASRVQLELVGHGASIALTVSDNGVGFDPQAPRKSSSFGLATQLEQVAALGGTLAVESSRGHGVRLTVTLPV